MAFLPATAAQTSTNSILDAFNRQTYLGEQYSCSSSFTVGVTETPLMLLSNAQTGSIPNLKALFQNLLKVIDTSASNSIIINVYVNPTISVAGSAGTVVNLRPAYTGASVATIQISPTASANGTLVDSISTTTKSVSSSNLLKVLDNGTSLLVTGIASSSSTTITTILQWYEL